MHISTYMVSTWVNIKYDASGPKCSPGPGGGLGEPGPGENFNVSTRAKSLGPSKLRDPQVQIRDQAPGPGEDRNTLAPSGLREAPSPQSACGEPGSAGRTPFRMCHFLVLILGLLVPRENLPGVFSPLVLN